MILIVGGTSSGKATYARKLAARYGWSENDMTLDVEELLWTQGDRTPPATRALLEQLATKRIVTCAEVGSGVVPLDRKERAWREAVGRMTCELAERATTVVRMVCGIPVVLKGPSHE